MGGGKGGSSLAVPAVNILTMMHKSWTADTGHSAPNARQTVGKMNVDSRMKSGSEFHIQARILGQDTLPIPLTTSNVLPGFLVAIAVLWSWQLNVLAIPKIEPRHETCGNEQRYENQVMCEGKSFGALVPYPDNCSLFLVCDCLYPTVKLCPANLWWDNKTQQCNYPQAVECIYYTIETPVPTDGTTKITPQPTSSTEKMTTESTTSTSSSYFPTSSWDTPPAPPGISEDFCHNYKDGSLHSYPYNCQAYINCTHGWPVLNYCIEDKLFNIILGICDTPDEVDCDERPLPTTTTEIPRTSTTEEDGVCGPTPEGVADDYCMPKGNGFYEYPYNCSGYLVCKNGCTDLDYCQPDKLFNTWLHICDTPDSVWCDPSPYPTTPRTTDKPTTPSITATPTTLPSEGSTTTERSTTTTEIISTTTPALPSDVDPSDCKGQPDGAIFAYIGNCSEYLICKDNVVEMGRCPPTTLFNPDLLLCDDPKDVVCLGDRTTTPIPTTESTTTTQKTTTITTTTTAATTLGPDQLCEGQEMGASFPYTEDCSKYYLCLGDGKWALAPCIYASYFDPTTGQCGPNVSPDACKASQATTTTTTTTEATTTEKMTTPKTTTLEPATTQKTTTTVSPTNGICGGRNENENVAYPNNCNKYIVCVSPIPIAFFCPDETFFSSKLQKCIDSWQESDCVEDQSTTTVEPGYTRPPPEPTMCTNSSRNTFPYPDNCQWFIRCVDDYIYMTDVCNCGEFYDPITEKCGADVPSDACRWDYTSTTSTTTEPTTTTPVTRPPPQKGPCDDVDDGNLVSYPNDCSKYIKCDRPIAEAFDCDKGDEFSVELGKCVDASQANCSIKTTAKPSQSTSTPNEEETSSSITEPTTVSSTESTTKSTKESSTETTMESTTESTTKSTTESKTDSTTESSSTESTTESSSETSSKPSTASTTAEPESSTTELGTTTSEASTTTKPSEGICEGKTDNSLVPYPKNCSKFIKCQYPIPVGYDCPNGLEFSPTELYCMDPESAGCSAKITTPGVTTLTTESSTTKKPITTTTPLTTVSTATTDLTTTQTSESTTVSTTSDITSTESTTVSTTSDTTTTESTTVSTTPKTTSSESTTVSTTPDTTTTEPTTVSTTPRTTTTESTTVSSTESTTTTVPPPTTLDPYTPNICCGRALGTVLAYPNDCSRYVVCDYPIPYAVLCEEGTVFDDRLLQCTAMPNERCLYMDY
ncbi:mucin-5AC [Drosophila subpulchrella]|uniref:mucin-5AC n=1 Tax=Drosophila subpulchrella TaxID=1486046 RepID=UPI0018A1690B|nr:mucin-5AC [Drosophila subpulchrella]